MDVSVYTLFLSRIFGVSNCTTSFCCGYIRQFNLHDVPCRMLHIHNNRRCCSAGRFCGSGTAWAKRIGKPRNIQLRVHCWKSMVSISTWIGLRLREQADEPRKLLRLVSNGDKEIVEMISYERKLICHHNNGKKPWDFPMSLTHHAGCIE